MARTARITLIGGPTVLLELGGLRLLTDPTFDAPGSYPSSGGAVTLTKRTGPALAAAEVGAVDAVLLSHDQHADNLDPAGRAFLRGAGRVLTTREGAGRLPGAEGLAPWERRVLAAGAGSLLVTATPARHGPPGIEPLSGEVTGFVVSEPEGRDLVYVTGDTVFYEGVAEVARRFRPAVVLMFTGAARTRGPFHLTMSVNDALETARAFPGAALVAVHNEGWAHFTETASDLERSFAALGQQARLVPLARGQTAEIAVPAPGA